MLFPFCFCPWSGREHGIPGAELMEKVSYLLWRALGAHDNHNTTYCAILRDNIPQFFFQNQNIAIASTSLQNLL